MDINSENILDFLLYATYPEKVAISILINNTLNMHVREDNILNYSHVPHQGKHRLTVILDSNIREVDYGETYKGNVRILYDKIDAALIYPNGFYVNKWVGSSEFSISHLLNLLHRNTKIIINEKDLELVTEAGKTYLQFKDTCLLWKGRISLQSIDSIDYVQN